MIVRRISLPIHCPASLSQQKQFSMTGTVTGAVMAIWMRKINGSCFFSKIQNWFRELEGKHSYNSYFEFTVVKEWFAG